MKSEVPHQPVDESKPVFTVDISTMHCQLHSTSSHDADRSEPLEPGPDGLLIARFGEIVYTTELSNLMLSVPPTKKRKTAPVSKKPAADTTAHLAAAEAPAAPLAAAAPAAPLAEAKDDYAILWYKNSKCCGIRAKFGIKTQVLSFGGKKSLKTEQEMRDFAQTVLVPDLHAGATIAETKQKGMDFAFPSA